MPLVRRSYAAVVALFMLAVTIACVAQSKKPNPASSSPKVTFHPYEVVDTQQGGLVVSRLAVPEGWKSTSKVIWNYNDFYVPVRVSARIESPDNSEWTEFYPADLFIWLDAAHDRPPYGHEGIGGIH